MTSGAACNAATKPRAPRCFGRDSIRLALIGQVANEYLALRSHDAQLEVTRQTLESRRESRKIVQARLDAGSASGLELAQAESALSGAQGQWSQVKRLRALAENQLGLLTGQPGLRIAAASLEQIPLPPTPHRPVCRLRCSQRVRMCVRPRRIWSPPTPGSASPRPRIFRASG